MSGWRRIAFAHVAALLATVRASVVQVTPIEKVITLLEDLETEIQNEGTAEAGTYDTYACFCKTTTGTRSTAITNGQDNIDSLAADIASDIASKAAKGTELMEKKTEVEGLKGELEVETARCLKEATEFEANMADLNKAISSLTKALQAMRSAKTSTGFLELKVNSTLQDEVERVLAIAEAMGLVEAPNHRAVVAFMQGRRVDPDAPQYKFHSDGIIKTLDDLETEFKGKRTAVQSEMGKAKRICDNAKRGLSGQIDTIGGEITTLETDIDGLESSIGTNRASLLQAEDMLKDDKIYLKDLTSQCESAAREWDERSKARGEELEVLGEALKILRDGDGEKKSVKDLEAEVGARAPAAAPAPAPANLVQMHERVHPQDKAAQPQAVPTSFLQQGLRATSLRSSSARLEQAEQFLRETGIKLKSTELVSVAESLRKGSLGKDIFAKVKAMIQSLIERLLEEARKEATKQGFCDKELGQAYTSRDFRLEDAKKLAADMGLLRSQNDTLGEDIVELEEALPNLYQNLNETTGLRATEKQDNLDRIKTAKEGVAAVSEAIVLLKTYYRSRAFVQTGASPVDEDTDGPGFSGPYRGQHDGARGVIGLLEVIKSDFDRAARQTAAAEKKAQEDFVEFEQITKSDIAAKETALELKTEDQKAVLTKMDKTEKELKTTQSLLDDAIKTVEGLKPMCLDMTQDYETRKKKREEEIDALKKVITYLTPQF